MTSLKRPIYSHSLPNVHFRTLLLGVYLKDRSKKDAIQLQKGKSIPLSRADFTIFASYKNV